jgi:hypothetical protein
VVTLFEITHGERAAWQRRAGNELAAILRTNRDLPIIAWTVGSAGADLVGHVNALAPAAEVRAAFHAWRAALMLPERVEATSGSGSVYLRAMADRNRAHVALTAVVLDDGSEG